MTLEQRNIMQIQEATEEYNLYMACEYYGHQPNQDEAIMYYAEHGGSVTFEQRHPEAKNM